MNSEEHLATQLQAIAESIARDAAVRVEEAPPHLAVATESKSSEADVVTATDKAVELLEQAQQGEPENAVIVEHLGDAYWKAGQRFRARYTWRAAALLAEEDMAARVAAKLEDGLTPQTTAP